MAPTHPRDRLTQALRREVGEQILQEHLHQATPQTPVAVLFFDLDHFKSINDAFGHKMGDEALRFVAAYFREHLPPKGAVVRYGGDEFFVLLPGFTHAQARSLGEKALAYFAANPLRVPQPLYLRLSIGVAVAPWDGTSGEQLLQVADRRHYFAKYSGGHRVIVSDRGATQSLIAFPRRPIGRQQALRRLHAFLTDLERKRVGVLRVQSPPYGGAAAFLETVFNSAQLKGYAVLRLRATPALRLRYLGLLAVGNHLPGPAERQAPDTLPEALAWLEEYARDAPSGLLVTIAHAEWIDEGTKEVLQHALRHPPAGKPFGVVYATTQELQARFRAPLFVSIDLPPLTKTEVHAWVRHALRWEPPEPCVQWLHETTEGLPDLIQPTLEALVEEGFLQPTAQGWQWYAPRGWSPARPPWPLTLPQVGAPPRLPLLFGRNRDLQALHHLIRHYPLITVTARGGEGKSRLLQQLALEEAAFFPNGAYYLSPSGPLAEELLDLLASVLQITLRAGQEALVALVEALQSKQMLLVLDDVAQTKDLGTFIQAVLQQAPQVRLVIGAREPLHYPEEHVFALRGLSAEDTHSPAVQLFLYWAQRSGEAFALSAQDLPHVVKICQWAQGSPLALRMMASWVSSWPIEEMLQRLQTNRLQANPLQVVLDRFWALLSPAEQRTLARLALFRGAFDAPAAYHVAEASFFFLEALTAKAYLQRTGPASFELHPLLQQYAEAKLRAMDPHLVAEARRRHAVWYLQRLPERAGFRRPAERWEFLAPKSDLPNIVAAWYEALQEGAFDLLETAGPWVMASLGDLNRFVETHHLIQRSLEHLKTVPPRQRRGRYYALRAYLELASAEFLYHLGKKAQAEERLLRLQRRFAAYFTPLQQAYLDLTIGKHYTHAGRYEMAEQHLLQALQVYRQVRLPRLLFGTLNALGVLAYSQRRLAQARAYFTEALEAAQRNQRYSAVAALLNNLSNIALQEGKPQEASGMLARALALLGDFDAPSLRASLLDTQGRVLLALDRPCAALRVLGQAIAQALHSGSTPNALEALGNMAAAWVRLRRRTEAATLIATLLTYESLRTYNRQELKELQEQLGEIGVTQLWEQGDLKALVRRVQALNRRWCAPKAAED